MAEQRKLPSQLQGAVNSRKGIKYTTAQLLTKEPRVELTLKLKSDIIDEAKKLGFKPDNVASTLSLVNQTELARQFNVSRQTINRILWSTKALKQKFLTSPADLKCNRSTKYGAIEEQVILFVTLLHNRPKPLPVSLSLIKAKADEVAKSLGITDFKASNRVVGQSQKAKWHWKECSTTW